MNNIKSIEEWEKELSSDPTIWHYDIYQYPQDELRALTSHAITVVTLFTTSLTTYFYVNDNVWKIDDLPEAITELNLLYGCDVTYTVVQQLELMLLRNRHPDGPYRDVSSFWQYFFKWE